MVRLHRKLLVRALLGSRYSTFLKNVEALAPQIETLANRVVALEDILANPRKLWLYQNREERMDANLYELFDEGRCRFHLARYEFAADYSAERDVMDLASGTGYGAALLAQDARSVRGIDISPEAVAYANDVYSTRTCKFHTASAANTQQEAESADLITSFETIEHVPCEEELLSEFHRVLRPGGLLIISTPNEWPLEIAHYHVREYDYSGFHGVLEKHFSVERFYNQNSGGPSPYNHEQPAGIVETTSSNRHLAECYIAVCRKRAA